MAVALFMMSSAQIYSDIDLLLLIGMSVHQVVQREDGDPQREGKELVEEEPVATPKEEAKKGRKVRAHNRSDRAHNRPNGLHSAPDSSPTIDIYTSLC